jgi:hypothetical protein
MAQLNKYKISWILLVPITGKATIKDVQLASKIVSGHKTYFSSFKGIIVTHQPSPEIAHSNLNKIKGKLSKTYYGYVVTDAQFGLASEKNKENSVIGIKLTDKQISDRIKV